MIVIPPIPITSSVLASSTVAEPSAGEVVWNAATSYAVGDVVIRTTTHRKYECQIAGVDSTTPSSAQAGGGGLYAEYSGPLFGGDTRPWAQGGECGSGGGWGAQGVSGFYGSVGAGGNSVIGNSFITWLATGTRLGPISA